MDLMGHALSPDGIGFVSYNALPGGYFRMAMRDMLLHEFGDIGDPEAKIAAAFDFLKPFVEAEPSNNAPVEMYRNLAQALLDRDRHQLFHDEMGEVFAPQSLTAVVSAAHGVGLRYLCDVEGKRLFQTFLEPDDDEDEEDIDRAVVRTAQSIDYREACFFRCSLFVRNTIHPSRLFDPNLIERLWISTRFVFDEKEGQFRHGDKHLKLSDERMNAAFHKISAARRARIPFAGLVDDEVRRQAFIRLFSVDYVELHTGPPPFVSKVGERPMSSPLVRAEIGLGRKAVARLDHTLLEIDQPHLRALLSAADGNRTIAEIARAVDGVFPAAEVLPALNAAAQRALMVG
jgi:hypothetical protein